MFISLRDLPGSGSGSCVSTCRPAGVTPGVIHAPCQPSNPVYIQRPRIYLHTPGRVRLATAAAAYVAHFFNTSMFHIQQNSPRDGRCDQPGFLLDITARRTRASLPPQPRNERLKSHGSSLPLELIFWSISEQLKLSGPGGRLRIQEICSVLDLNSVDNLWARAPVCSEVAVSAKPRRCLASVLRTRQVFAFDVLCPFSVSWW
ncbi:hypothetical protein LY76DRAFT_179803 [Colletotrichum caudatum]|nr:hypothetical protein LY76DRAFT_179803 [Colletotrichum caudatum]